MIIPKYNKFKQERQIGEYTIILPSPPDIKDIAYYNLPKDKQIFTVTKMPKNIMGMDKHDREAFEAQEWERRKNGFWFMNNGNIEYITGPNYFYINWWMIDTGLPDFVDSDRDWFYMWDFTKKNPKARGFINIENRRGGKALDVNTDIPTLNGWKKMLDLKVGDSVFGSDGKPTKITFVSDIMLNNDCYNVEFSDGSSIVADGEHLWIAYDRVDRWSARMGKSKEFTDPKVVTTLQMKSRLKYYKDENNWSIANCLPVEYEKKALSVPPYILGIWLGDGTSSGASITNIDKYIIDKWAQYGRDIGLDCNVSDEITYRLVNIREDESQKEQFKSNVFRKLIKDKDLYNNKHIPIEYLQSSVSDRLELLRGLMDTDGSNYKDSATCEYCSKSELLIDGVKELIVSLGCKVRKTSKINKKFNKRYFYLRFTPNNIMPFAVPRKVEMCVKTLKGGWKPNHRYITSIVPVLTVPVRCIAVDNSNSSYLCSKDFIVTHNTFRSVSTLYEGVSRTPNSQGGIQSKNGPDAGKVFKKLVFSWRKLPYFFKPIDIGESYPKTKLEFTEPSTRDTKNQNKQYGLILDSFIDFENAKEEAYDGTKQLINFQDEIGKCVEVDVNERIKIVKECVMDGSKIIGKIIGTTTVEEMEKKGGANCKKIWDGADPTRLLPNGQTQNGLLRYFKPAYYGFRGESDGESFIDRYGYSDQDAAKKYIENNRAALIDRDDVTSDRRKYPFTIRDCFIQDSRKAFFDTAKIEQQIESNLTDLAVNPSLVVRGNFSWKNGIQDTEVEWHPDANGRWSVAWLQRPELRGKIVMKHGKKAPANTESGCFGLDPYDNKTTVDNKKSDAASYGMTKYDPMLGFDSGNFVTEYVNRPKLPEIMWEDMILQCVFFGWEILIESNKIGTINHFRRRGYENYLMMRPEETQTDSSRKMDEPGIPMSGEDARMALLYATESHIIKKVGLIEEDGVAPYMGKCYFNKLLQCWLDFDFDKKWTEFDSMVGAGLAILGNRKYTPIKKERVQIELFKKYATNGNSLGSENNIQIKA